ncbi:MAG TPA: DUF1156 domain-containing protein, partial [Bellilinea sp.]|nr:DUF1156 domain-containing protein [Bellilinea sp.]
MPTYRRKLIEVALPIEAINKEALRRKQKAPKGYPTSIHKYWAQRPIAACRAVLFAQLVDDPSAWPERFPTRDSQDRERERLHDLIRRLILWEASKDEAVLNEARWEIARSMAWSRGDEPPERGDGTTVLAYLRDTVPPVYDPFCGGGSIPLEAQRLGLRVLASDLNPVAVLVSKALVEIPPKFAGLPPVNPEALCKLGEIGSWSSQGAQGLAEDVRYFGRWIRNEMERRIGHLYPKARLPDGSEATVIAWIWARTVRSPDPTAQGAMVPLVSNFLVSTKEGRKAWVEPVRDPAAPDGYRFEVRTGTLVKADEERLKRGTKAARGASFVCLLTCSAISGDWIKAEGKAGRTGTRLMAIVAEGARGRIYLSPTPEHERIAAEIERTEATEIAQALPDDPRNFWTVQYGLDRFDLLFTPRQLLALTTFADLIALARENVLVAARAAGLSDDPTPLASGGTGAAAYADAVATYLAIALDRMAFYGSNLVGWLTKDNALGKTMPRQALAMSWDFAEGNYLEKCSSGIVMCCENISSCIGEAPANGPCNVTLQAAQSIKFNGPFVFSTDPPYYDNMVYAELSDFFYVWLRRCIGKSWPDLFRRLLTPKEHELVATPYRHGGRQNADRIFMEGMKEALSRIRTASEDSLPLTIYYAFKQSEEGGEGIISAGWASFLQAIINAGLMLDGTWPLRTEGASRATAQNTNALASSIVLVCRKRPEGAPIATRAEFLRALKGELPDALV